MLSRTAATATVHVNKASTSWHDDTDDRKLSKNNYTKKTNTFQQFAVLFITIYYADAFMLQ